MLQQCFLDWQLKSSRFAFQLVKFTVTTVEVKTLVHWCNVLNRFPVTDLHSWVRWSRATNRIAANFQLPGTWTVGLYPFSFCVTGWHVLLWHCFGKKLRMHTAVKAHLLTFPLCVSVFLRTDCKCFFKTAEIPVYQRKAVSVFEAEKNSQLVRISVKELQCSQMLN